LRIRTGQLGHNAGAVRADGLPDWPLLFGLLFLDNPAIWRIAIDQRIIRNPDPARLCQCPRCSRCYCPKGGPAGQRSAFLCPHIVRPLPALVLALSYVTLEIQGSINGPDIEQAERPRGRTVYLFEIAWLAFGVAFLGICTRSIRSALRLPSAAVKSLWTIVKGIPIDMSTNSDGGLINKYHRSLVVQVWPCLSALVLVAIGCLFPSGSVAAPTKSAGGGLPRSPANKVTLSAKRDFRASNLEALGSLASFRTTTFLHQIMDVLCIPHSVTAA